MAFIGTALLNCFYFLRRYCGSRDGSINFDERPFGFPLDRVGKSSLKTYILSEKDSPKSRAGQNDVIVRYFSHNHGVNQCSPYQLPLFCSLHSALITVQYSIVIMLLRIFFLLKRMFYLHSA